MMSAREFQTPVIPQKGFCTKKAVLSGTLGLTIFFICFFILYTDVIKTRSLVFNRLSENGSSNEINVKNILLTIEKNNTIAADNQEEEDRMAVENSKKQLNVQKGNNSEILLGLDIVKTKLTFDPNITATCVETPLTLCSQKVKVAITDKVFRIAVLRRPIWILPSYYDFSHCEFNKCIFDDQKVTEATDVIHINGVGLKDSFVPPQYWAHQLYILSSWESPVHTGADFLYTDNSPWNRKINLTMSYRVDSDVFVPYSKIKFSPRPLKERPNYYEISKTKTKTAAWFVSNCRTPSRRSDYVQEMKKYIDVDVYGGCGIPCPKNGGQCMEFLRTTYKFYLSFENSLCTDYITEKLTKLFVPEMHIIPVIRGGADYNKYFPNMTYINAADFKTAKDLALFLKNLASDLVTYSKYLEYKDMYVSTGDELAKLGCSLCEYLHMHVIENKVYNMKKWMGEGHCHEPNDVS